MASLRKRGKVWYYKFIDGDGRPSERKGCPDRRATEEMARAAESEAAKLRAGLIDTKAVAYRAHEARPLAEHLDDFRKAMEAAGRTPRHVQMTASRASKMVNRSRARRISDLSLSKALDALASLRSEGLGAETLNHYVRAVKAFSRWLWKDGRAREHVLAHLSTSNSEFDRRHKRRALTPGEAVKLISAAGSGSVVKDLDGPDRAILYRLAMGTGFRADELRTLTPERFHLDADPPSVTVLACYSKNGHEAIQPLPSTLADQLRPWLATRAPGKPVFGELTDRTAEMIRVDLEAADIPYETDSGVCDFHSLRGVYISNLVSSGASVKTCQVLARHSTPSLTIGIYAKASLHDIKGAMDALPDLTATGPGHEAENMAATGTDGQPISNRLATHLPLTGDGTGRNLAVTGGNDDVSTDFLPVMSMGRNPLETAGLDGPSRELTAPVVVSCERRESNPHPFRDRNLNPTRLPVPPLSQP